MYASSLQYVLRYEIECCNFQDVLSKFVHLTYDIEDITKCELTVIYISIIIVTYIKKETFSNFGENNVVFGDASFFINLITKQNHEDPAHDNIGLNKKVNEHKTRACTFFVIRWFVHV